MEMKRCSKCHEVKPLDEFHRSKSELYGRHHYCKPCKAKSVNLQVYRDYLRRYRRTAKGSVVTRTSGRSYWIRNPHKKAAKDYVYQAVKAGKIIRPNACSICKVAGKVEGHHEDYSKPLDVIWLCRLCHKGLHRNAA